MLDLLTQLIRAEQALAHARIVIAQVIASAAATVSRLTAVQSALSAIVVMHACAALSASVAANQTFARYLGY